MKRLVNIRVSLVCIIAALIFTLPHAALSQRPEWTVYTTSNSGLPYKLISALACDDRGNVWIGTGDPYGNGRGLAKFDGDNWTVYNTSNSPLPHNAVFAFAPDMNGGIWIGTGGGLFGVGRGLAYFDGTSSWTLYDISNSELPHNNIKALTLDSVGNLWIGTDGGMARFDGTNWIVYNRSNSGLPNNKVYAIAIDEQQNKWIGTYGGGLAKFDGTNWEVFNRSNSPLPYNNVYAVAIDAQDNKWIGTANHTSGPLGGGLAKFDGQNWTVYNKANSGQPHNDVYAVVIDTDGSVWTGSGDHIPASVGGLARFDGVSWTVHDKQNSEMTFNLVYAVAIDSRGTKWIGSVNFDEPGGLVSYRVVPAGDFNDDEVVDLDDLVILIEHWGTDDPLCDIAPPPVGDGVVDILDLELFMEYYEPADSSEEVHVDANDDGGRVVLEQGQVLVVTLESNPSTGYRWEVVENQDSILEQDGQAEFKPSDEGEPPMAGAGGWEIFRFKAVSAGQETVQLLYRRSWEEDVEPVKTYSIDVVVN